MQQSQRLQGAPAVKANATATNGYTNGANGYFSPPDSPSLRFGGSTRGSRRMTSSSWSVLKSSSSEKSTIVRDTAIHLKRKSTSELGAGISDTADNVGFINLVEWIRTERLHTLPHKGSRWDTVLIRALYFAERLHGFESALKGHAVDSEHAAQIGYGHVKVLLELGHENGAALDKAFGFMYRCSSAVSALLARSEVLSFSSEIYQQLCMMYSDLLTLVVDVAVRFYKAVHGNSGEQASLDMYHVFGSTIQTFRERRDKLTKAIWKDQMESEEFGGEAEVNVLERWLAPEDRILETLSLDHTLIADDLAEFTCVWFNDELSKFVKSSDSTLLINGPQGSGKTTLAASLAERLQRPIARKTYSTIFVSVGAVPSQANSFNVVKALLHQLLSLRVGNLHLVRAILTAYEQARYEPDPAKHEDLLWVAFEDALRHPIEQGRDTVIVVDGIDEVLGGASAGQSLLQRLIKSVEQGKCVKLIGMSQNLSLPSGTKGTRRSLAREEMRDDVHAVALRALIHSSHFRQKTGREQETIISRIIEAASGDFLWASLTAEVLKLEKTADDFNKAVNNVQSPKLTVDDLVHILVSRLQPTDDAKLLLSWLTFGARPLTYHEIECIFAMNVQTGDRADRRVDVHSTVFSLKPLFTIQEDIVRPRHTLVQQAVRNLIKSGKITNTIKDQPTDLLLRLLTYAKVTLTEKGEPTLDDSDRSIVDHWFSKNVLLEYVVRYYTWHLKQTGVVTTTTGKAPELKVTPELQKVFPDSTILAVLEWLCWEYPGAQEVEYHDLAGRLRTKIFTEKHPSVIQSYINTASYWEVIEDWTKVGNYYYSICTLGRDVLGNSHPIVVEACNRFLRNTETTTTITSRTELVTRRETVLIWLISAYERQFGAQSDMVIRVRELLADLYMAIKEEDKAKEILRVIHGHTIAEHGRDSDRVREMDQHLRVSLGKKRDGKELEGYERGIFIDEDEDEEATAITSIEQVDAMLLEIKKYMEQKDYIRAEQSYVELWQRLSEKTRTTLAVEWHEKKIQVIQQYAEYLESHKRRTEATSLQTSLWREYEHHELSYNEKVVSHLTKSARFLKTVGEYSAALAIFRHASSYFRNTRKEESRSLTEIEEEMTVISNQALTQSTRDVKQSTSTSESSHHEMFQVLISNKSKSVESSTVTLAKSLTSRYIEQKQWSKAISVIHATLERTWSSFLSKSIHEVTLTSTYQKESIELVEQLAQVHIERRQWEKAEEVYSRLFRASLTSTNDTTLLEKAKTLLIGFYTRRGHAGKIISVYQELLAFYRRSLGPSHETTIAMLYELGSRCRAHARSHPYWLEYYQQIVAALNKDSHVCHPRALEAALIVAESYWEERRYSDAVAAYQVVWTTFVQKHQEFKYFGESKNAQSLYERYYQSLEESQADFDVLRSVTSQYRETSKAVFGAQSGIFVEATVALARVTQSSEAHMDECISLYEEAAAAASASKSSSSSSSRDVDVTQALTSLYQKRIFQSGSASASSETIARASTVYQEQLQQHKRQYTYAHDDTLGSLRALAMLYVRQQKTELAVKELHFAAVDIVQHEESSEKMYQSATSLAHAYRAAGLTAQGTQLMEELHYQLVTREKRSTSSFSVVDSAQSAIFFLAVMQHQLGNDRSRTLSEIMSRVTAESIAYANFKQLVKSKASLDKLLLAAAPLRHLLRVCHHAHLIPSVDSPCVDIFVAREAANVSLLSKHSPRLFIVGILDHIANRKCLDFVRSVILSTTKTVQHLVDNNKFADAHDVAKMSFLYAQFRKGYSGPKGISRGFELASYLDGRGENRCPDAELRKKLLALSNQIVKDILNICREQQINLAQVSLTELNELIALLGEQQDYETLEELLNTLWNTREAQRSWPSDVLLNLGRCLICARYLAGYQIKAVRLAEDIAYNLRRVNGIKHSSTIEAYGLLAELYSSVGNHYQKEAGNGDKAAGPLAAEHFKKAMIVHEDTLRWLLSDTTGGEVGGDADDDDTAATILAEHGVHVNAEHSGHGHATGNIDDAKRTQLVQKHMRLLKLAYQRVGQWPKQYAVYEKLNAELFKVFPEALKGYEGVEKWQVKGFGSGKAESNEGQFKGSAHWEILAV
ncbi:uncharacterized protein MYCFIDRAFT_60116 [Pseudocercospora fijiensis CIRAD86]|uniref:AAA+ ATPase domain-containing protein n=1 Tax=Pseudocercospora fijiensis (strain CIRAD86) TaxID=383855 RepID=M2ZYU2_PSEFD|nr:uncharacterized protein MYCFIDRAFT_60116 [Pseudocercospora fijiensis CIRAD86]EME77291.1 hypothetical protein MYCFIDRAFT_60116 [Pseudocercospora fijiensis CIRAD86]